jgi:ATP-dependent Clp protease adapter protein ClpS
MDSKSAVNQSKPVKYQKKHQSGEMVSQKYHDSVISRNDLTTLMDFFRPIIRQFYKIRI